MEKTEDPQQIKEQHKPEAIRERIAEGDKPDYLGDAVLGAIDGIITTFAIVTGSMGGGFDRTVIVVLGIANIVADSLSMAVSNYLGTRSERERVEDAREAEMQHHRIYPQLQEREIRMIFEEKGFEGQTLERIVQVISEDQEEAADTVLKEALGMQPQGANPIYAALATLGTFLLGGAIPLIPFLIPGLELQTSFIASIIAAGVAFVAVGIVKGAVLKRPLLRSALETFATGGAAAGVAYAIGTWLRTTFGAS